MLAQDDKIFRSKYRSHFPKFSILASKLSLILVILLAFFSGSALSQSNSEEIQTTTHAVRESSDNKAVQYSIESFAQNVGLKGPNVQPQILRKCSGSVKEKFFNVPPPLRAHAVNYESFRLPHFQQKYGPYMYNFTLVDLNHDHDHDSVKEKGLKAGIKSPCQDILFDDKEDLLNSNNTEVFIQLSFNGGANVQGEWSVINPDGYLIRHRGSSEIAYNPLNYCIARIDPPNLLIRVCRSTCSIEKGWNANEVSADGVCIPKCCSFGKVVQLSESDQMSCVPVYDKDWAPLPPKFDLGHNHQTFFDFQLNNYVDQGWSCSLSNYILSKDGLWVSPRRKIYWRNSSIWGSWQSFDLTSVTPDKWKDSTGSSSKLCMDGIWNFDSNAANVDVDLPYDPKDPRAGQLLFFCEHNPEFIFPPLYLTVQFIVFVTASAIHLVTLSVFLALWSQHNVHGYTIMTFCLAQFSLEFLEFLVRFFQLFYDEAYQKLFSCSLVTLCIALGALQQFLIIMCFSWTTVLCFDIFSTIRSTKPGAGSSKKKKKGWRRFGLYALFGGGVPLVWTVAALIIDIDAKANREPMDGVITPNFSLTCFINEKWPFYVYALLPISLLTLTNLALTFSTVKFVWESKRNVQSMKDSASSGEGNNMELIIKLCVMMGIFLLFDVGYSVGNPVVQVSSYLVFLESYWILQALATFWIFVWNEPMLKQLTTTYPVLQKVFRHNQATSSS